jgi:3-hydroxybutyryl-CoA dehydrogenase
MPSNLRYAEERVRQLQQQLQPGVAVEFASSVENAVREAGLIIDCVPDELESKLEIFSLLDRMAPPEAIFATPTLTLSIADLASCTYRPGRCVSLELDAAAIESDAGFPKELPVVHTVDTLPEVIAVVVGFLKALGVEAALEVDRPIRHA